jgi:hypothetical protein
MQQHLLASFTFPVKISAGCEAPICRAFLLIHSAFGYGFVESRNIWGLSLGRNFDRKGERGPPFECN